MRPLSPIKGLRSHQKVRITLETSLKQKHPLAGLCGTLPDEDAAEMLKGIEDELDDMKRTALSIIGIGKSSLKDSALKHDEYLYGKKRVDLRRDR